MKQRDIRPGLRVEITGYPWSGRAGVVRGKGRVMLLPVWEIWCDNPDWMGRQLVKVKPRQIRPEKVN